MKTILVPVIALLATCSAFAQQDPKPKTKPAFQYKTEGIEVSIPTADEPRVAAFNADTIRAAAKYLEDGALTWVREKSCINCHTTGPYMTERPALKMLPGKPSEEVLENFVKAIATKPSVETEKDGLKYFPGSWTSVWCSLGLAEWDKHVNGKLSEHTDRSLREMMLRQSANGAFVTFGEVEVPHITTDFELTLQAARAITAAPGWLAGLKDADLLARIGKMKEWLRTAQPKNDFDRVLRLQLASYMPDIVTQPERDAALTLLSQKQHADGGWSLRDMSPVNDWHFKMSDTVLKIIASLPDAAKPESDPYMTALAIVLMKQSGIATTDARIQRAVAWLKREQRV